MAYVFFGYFAGMIAITSMLVVVLRNPVYGTLSLLVMFFHVAGLYITLHAEFLAAVQIIVYAGAIVVLYLFVVMLLNVNRDERYHSQSRIAVFVCVPLAIEFLVLLSGGMGAARRDPASIAVDPQTTDNTLTIGQTLYSTYLYSFEVASLILLAAMIGAILLAKPNIDAREAKDMPQAPGAQ